MTVAGRSQGKVVSLVDYREAKKPERWVGAAMVADHFGVTTKTIERWRKKGMPSRKPPGQHRRYRISECDDWFQRLG